MTKEISRSDVVSLLSTSLGTTRAELTVRAAMSALQLNASELQFSHVLALLEKIAEEPGIVGITARFAKTRAFLRWPS